MEDSRENITQVKGVSGDIRSDWLDSWTKGFTKLILYIIVSDFLNII